MQNEEKSLQNDSQALLSIGEAAEFTGVSIDTLRRWERRGRLVAFRSPGGHRYFEKEKLKDLFNQKYIREPKPTPPSQEIKVNLEPQAPVQPVVEPSEPKASEAETILIPKTSIPAQEVRPAEEIRPAPQETTPPHPEEATKISEPSTPPQLSVQNEGVKPEEEKPQVRTQEQLLKSVFDVPLVEKRKFSKAQIAAILGLVVFAIVDIVLIIVWFSTPKLLSPIP